MWDNFFIFEIAALPTAAESWVIIRFLFIKISSLIMVAFAAWSWWHFRRFPLNMVMVWRMTSVVFFCFGLGQSIRLFARGWGVGIIQSVSFAMGTCFLCLLFREMVLTYEHLRNEDYEIVRHNRALVDMERRHREAEQQG